MLKQRSYEKDGEKRSVTEFGVQEIGPSLKSATAKVARAQRNGNSQGSSASSGGNWGGGGTPPGGAWGGNSNPGGGDTEPPF